MRVAVFLLCSLLPALASAATFTVNANDDVNDAVCDATHCSLREAINAANADGTSGNRIEFAMPGATDIHPTTALPVITVAGLTIDGLTQAGSSGSPLVPVVALLGNLCSGCSGLRVSGSAVVIEGLRIGQWTNGIHIQSASTNAIVRKNWIGLSATGLAGLANNMGVVIDGDGAIVGGLAAGSGNVISGNTSRGISISDVASGNGVYGNLVGLPANGDSGDPCVPNSGTGLTTNGDGTTIGEVSAPNVFVCNTNVGVELNQLSDGTMIRGNRFGDPDGKAMVTSGQNRAVHTTGTNVVIGGVGQGNVFALHEQWGIVVGTSDPTVIHGNYFGVDDDGVTVLADLPNDVAISVGNNSRAEIGGPAAGEGNIITNQFSGITITGSAPTTIRGNLIGVKADGSALGFSHAGISIGGSSTVTIGGTGPGEGNVISGALFQGSGIRTDSGFSTIEVVGNSIFANGASNGGWGFDLGSFGPNPNDAQDPDVGPNGLQNYPVLTSATIDEVTGTLNSNPSTDFFVDFYANTACDPSGFGEGETYLATIALTTNTLGNASFSDVPYGTTLSGTAFVTAMARRQDTGATSEFSACRQVAPPSADIAVQISAVPPVVDIGDDVSWDITVSNMPGPNAAEVVELEVTLPTGATFLGAVPSTGSCSETGGVVSCAFGTITLGSSVTVEVTTSLDGGGDVTLLAAATTITQQPDLTDDSAASMLYVNRPPVVPDATVPADEDVAEMLTVQATDADDDPLQWSLESGPANGTLSGTLPNVTYTPDPDFFGTDSFDVEAFDGRLFSGTATITLQVAPINDLPIAGVNDYTASEDVILTVDVATGALSDDSDVEGSSLTAILENDVINGTLQLQIDGSFAYQPDANFSGIDGFTYRASDGSGSSAPASVSIVVNSSNDSPIASSDAYDTLEDNTLLVAAAAGTLVNDADPDGPAMTAELVNDVSNGTLALSADGAFTYAPDAQFSGTETFQYRATDGTLVSGTVVVTINVAAVNDVPAAAADDYAVEEDGLLSVTAAAGVLANDSDIETAGLSAVLVTDVANGSLVLQQDGSFDYVPDLDFSGVDAFVYRASDGVETSATTTVSIVVSGIGDPPVALSDAFDGVEDQVLIVETATGLLANDVDADGGALSVELVDGNVNGLLMLGADGAFVYTPDPDVSGIDTFTYRVSDGVDVSGDVLVTLTISATPDDPPSPVASEPADGVVVEDPIVFGWTAVTDADGEAVSYRLELFEGSDILASFETTGTSFTATDVDALESGTYGWRVIAVDTSGAESAPSAFRTFVIEGGVGGGNGCGCSLTSRRADPPSILLAALIALSGMVARRRVSR